MRLPNPSCLVLAATLLQIEHRIAKLALRIVIRRQIDQRMSPGASNLRVVPNLTHLPMGYILRRIIGGAWLRDFYAACEPAASEVRLSPGIADVRTVNVQGVIVEAGNERNRSDGPEPIRLFLHINLRSAPEIQLDLRGLG